MVLKENAYITSSCCHLCYLDLLNITCEETEIIYLIRLKKVYSEPGCPPLPAFWPQHMVVHEVDEYQDGGSVEIDHNHREEVCGARGICGWVEDE